MHPSWSLEDHFSSVYWFLQASPFLFEFQSETHNVFSCSLSLLRLKSSVSSHQTASKDRRTWSLCCGFSLGASLRSAAGRVIFRGHRPLDVLIPGDKHHDQTIPVLINAHYMKKAYEKHHVVYHCDNKVRTERSPQFLKY